MGYTRNVKKLYLVCLFQSLIPAYIIERLFWQERGMNVQMVVACELVYAFAVLVLEVPSGILADRFGRRRLIVLDGALSALEFAVLLFANSFWMFALAVFLSGVGKAFSSGSQNALLYDSLLAENRENEFEKHMGRMSAIDLGGSMIAALSGGVLAELFGFEFNYILSIASMAAAFLVSLFLKEPPMATRPEEGQLTGAVRFMKEALGLFRKKPLVLLYCLTGAVLGSCMIYLDEFWPLVVESVGVPVFLFGAVSALTLSLRIPGNLFAYRLKEKFSFRTILTAVILVTAICYGTIFYTRNAFCIIPMAVIFLAAGILDPLLAGYLHHNTESGIRATVESFSSLGLRFFAMLTGVAFGFVSARYTLFTGFAVLAVLCTGYFFYFIFAPKKES